MPAYLVAVWAAFAAGRVARPVIGVVLVLGVTYLLVILSEGVDRPLALWPFVVAALAGLAGAYVGLETRVSGTIPGR